jgi:undecaprenyl-diphosphatase
MLDYLRHIDQQTFLSVYNYVNQIDWLGSLSFYIARYGILIFIILIVYLFYRAGDEEQKARDRRAILYIFISLALAFLADEILNLLKVRHRPFVSFPDRVAKLNVIQDLTSFPSTHTIFVFAISVSLWISKFKKLAVPLMFLSLLVGLSRIAVGVHYPFDILGGMILGIFIPVYVHHQRGWFKKMLKDKDWL